MEGRVRWLALPLVAMHPAVARRERGFGVDEDIEESRTISRTISATRRAEIGLLLGQMRGEGGATVFGRLRGEMEGMPGTPTGLRAGARLFAAAFIDASKAPYEPAIPALEESRDPEVRQIARIGGPGPGA